MSDPNNLDKVIGYEILKSDFKMMINAVKSFSGTPTEVYLRKNSVKQITYVTWGKWVKLVADWNNFINKYKREPNFLYLNPPATTSPTVALPADLELFKQVHGVTLTSLTQLDSWVRNNGTYQFEECVTKTYETAVKQAHSPGNNCENWLMILIHVKDAFNSMGKKYTVEVMHVDCKKSSGAEGEGHVFGLCSGEELKGEQIIDLAEASSGRRGMGSTMCTYGYAFLNHDLCYNKTLR